MNKIFCIFVSEIKLNEELNNKNNNKSVTIMTKRKLYEKPSMKVHVLKQRARLLVGSDQVNASMNGEWEEETI